MDFSIYTGKFMQYYSNEITPLLKETIELEKDKHYALADLGCGDGSTLYAIKKLGLLESYSPIYAIDLSQARVDNAIMIDNRIHTMVADACNLTAINDQSIDFIISIQVIEHVKDDELMIQEISRILRNNGVLYISTVFKNKYAWYFYRNEDKEWVIDPTHLREYTNDMQLVKKLVDNRLEIVKSCKTLQWFPISDFFLKRIGFRQYVYEQSSILRIIRKFRVPIIGYYNWELLCKKR